jgi:pimeloyl-ACP methyl ester carboxylesterase/DNA-binding winged helix-turn-helix (wHTH) protein
VRCAFPGYVLDTDRFALRRGGPDGQVVHLEPQVFDVLAHLIAHRDALVTKAQLLDAVWGDRFVSDSALTSRIKAARQAVGDDGKRQEVIQTVHGRGYRFVAPVTVLDAPPVPPPPALDQQIHFCTAPDGVRLAYATMGSGPPLVRAAHWMTHLDYDVRSPVWRHWLAGLSSYHTFVRYDERGCGLSDHDTTESSLTTWVDDLAAVVDAAGLDSFALLGVSQGGAVSIAYATRYPERVTRLVLLNAYVQGRMVRARTEAEREEAALQAQMAVVGWGRDDAAYRHFFASQFLPGGEPALWDAFAELQRRTTSPANARRILAAFAQLDVTDLAKELRVPTLILHSRDDRRVPASQARELASLIPGSRLVLLDSENHLFLPDEPAWTAALDEIQRFLGAPT